MDNSRNALKLSLMSGLFTGIGSVGLYYLISSNKGEEVDIASLKEQRRFANETEEMEDEAQIARLMSELKKELESHPSEPEYFKDENGVSDLTFTKEFMLKLNYITSKYQILMTEAIKNQQRNRRESAIEADDDQAFAKALYDYNRRLNFTTTVIHDTIFDYFGISTTQIEISGSKNEKDIEFKLKMLRQAQDLLNKFSMDDKEDKPEPNAQKLKELGEKLKAMQNNVIEACK